VLRAEELDLFDIELVDLAEVNLPSSARENIRVTTASIHLVQVSRRKRSSRLVSSHDRFQRMANNQVLDLTPGQLANIFEPQRLHQCIPFDSRPAANPWKTGL